MREMDVDTRMQDRMTREQYRSAVTKLIVFVILMVTCLALIIIGIVLMAIADNFGLTLLLIGIALAVISTIFMVFRKHELEGVFYEYKMLKKQEQEQNDIRASKD